MGRLLSVAFGAAISYGGGASADTIALAVTPPVPSIEAALPSLPDIQIARFETVAPTYSRGSPSNFAQQVQDQADTSAFGLACAEQIDVTPGPDATFLVEVTAPCRPEEQVLITYAGLAFDMSLSMTGYARAEVPALSYFAELDTVFDDYSVLSADVTAPEIYEYARVAVAWSGSADARLTSKAPRHLPVDVVTLGDGSGAVAQVLSHRIAPDARRGVIRLGLVAQVTAINCNTSQEANILQQVPGRPAQRYAMRLAPAGCDRIGDILELKNILPDLKLASN